MSKASKRQSKRANRNPLARFRQHLIETLEERRLLAGDFQVEVDLSESRPGDFYLPPRTTISGAESEPNPFPKVQVALEFLRENAEELGLTVDDLDEYRLTDQYATEHNGVTHLYFQQTHSGLDVAFTDISVDLLADGRVVSASSNFVAGLPDGNIQPLTPALSASDAVVSFASEFGYTITENLDEIRTPHPVTLETTVTDGGFAEGDIPARLAYVPTPDGDLELAWQMEVFVRDGDHPHYFDTLISADDGRPLGYADRAFAATYTAFGLPLVGPPDGNRALLTDPADRVASPFGWHDTNGIPGAEFTDTRGNNAFVQEDANNDDSLGNRPNGGAGLNFNFPLDLLLDATANEDAENTTTFVVANQTHDVLFHYGFDEVAGNFQGTNYTGGGLAGDVVIVDTFSGPNVGFWIPTPDGVSPRMELGFLDVPATNPRHTFSLDPHVVIHEYVHGLSTRLVGGPGNAAALNALQSGGMGEGWSDYFSLAFTQKSTDRAEDARPLGPWSAVGFDSDQDGIPDDNIRRNPYSFDLAVDPITFEDYNGGGLNNEVHNAGEIWASALWDMHWLLTEKYGFDADFAQGEGGNNLALQLIIDGMKLAPSNPSFTEARDAILAADEINNKGVNHLEIWTAFARRGLGFSADAVSAISIVIAPAFDLPPTPADITGTVYLDDNGDADFQPRDEATLGGWTMYIDLNQNRQLDKLEPIEVSDQNGVYKFVQYIGGVFDIRQVSMPGFVQTEPGGTGTQTVTVVKGSSTSDVDFGVQTGIPGIHGLKFNDLNGNGFQEANEPGLAGIYVYLDLGNDGLLHFGDPAAVTGKDGTYTIQYNIPGEYTVREAISPGWEQTFPGGSLQGHEITVEVGVPNTNINFGNTASIDFGDSPDAPYATLLANNGAAHGILPGFSLGNLVDSEVDGQPNANADGDGFDDDGIAFTSNIFAGVRGSLIATVSNGDSPPGVLQGWIDFDQDGSYEASEQILTNATVSEGANSLVFDVPLGATVGPTHARFRYGYEYGMGPTGRAIAGEVEDYMVLVLDDQPIARDDAFSVQQDSFANQFDVLANDFPSSTGPISVVDESISGSNGATITVAPDGQSIFYSPAPGFFSPPIEQFTYRITDGQEFASASVSVNVAPTFNDPLAVDDHEFVTQNSSNNIIDVLDNDIAGTSGPLTIVGVSDPANGSVQIENQGSPDPSDDVILYTPDANFSNYDEFTYTVADTNGVSRQANVSVIVNPSAGADDLLNIIVEVRDQNDQDLTEIGAGSLFQVVVSVQDTRIFQAEPGVFAAYMDLLAPRTLVAPVPDGNNPLGFDITFSDEYDQVLSGSAAVPGIINEVGSVQDGLASLGTGKIEMFRISYVANGIGVARFASSPADVSPAHDVLLFDPVDPVPVSQVGYGFDTLRITGAPFAEGSFFNAKNPFDVNNDNFVTPIDALAVINVLNDGGSGPLTGGGEGEGEDEASRWYIDVNGDNYLSPGDALRVINHLNSLRSSGEGEGQLTHDLAASSAIEATPFAPLGLPDSPRQSRRSEVSGQLQDTSAERRVDEFFRDNEVRLADESSSRQERNADDDEYRPLDDLLDDLAGDVKSAWSA